MAVVAGSEARRRSDFTTSARRTRAGQRFEVEIQDQVQQPARAGRTNVPPRIPSLRSRRKAISCATPRSAVIRSPATERRYILRLTLSPDTPKVNAPKVVLPCPVVTGYRNRSFSIHSRASRRVTFPACAFLSSTPIHPENPRLAGHFSSSSAKAPGKTATVA